MKRTILILIALFFVSSTWALSAEKNKTVAKLDASRATVDAIAGKVGDNREALAALEKARSYLQKASDLQTRSRQLFGINIGFGGLKPEAEEEINNYLEIVDNVVATATSRLENARTSTELEIIDKQLASVKTRIKVYEDRKAELEKLKADAAKCQVISKELETLKLENSRFSSQIEKQLAEIKALTDRLEEAKKTASEPVKSDKNTPVTVTLPVPAKEIPSAKEQTPVRETPTQK
ncbi:MAG: hypothetical protein PHD54_04460 [Desulfuromonadaceae bacterium]|nr:hypothetical protein [Desulfuromonadaceae bacterium]